MKKTAIHAGPIVLGGHTCEVVSHDAVLTRKKKGAVLVVTLELRMPDVQTDLQSISMTLAEHYKGKKGRAKAEHIFATFKQGVVIADDAA